MDARSGKPRRRKALLWGLGAGVLATLALCGVYHREILSAAATHMALSDARRMAAGIAAPVQNVEGMDRAVEAIAEKYGAFFRAGLLDRDQVADEFPAAGITPEVLPAILTIAAYYTAGEEKYRDSREAAEEAVFAEFLLWLDPVLERSKSREVLVNLLTGDYTLFVKGDDRDAGLFKRGLFIILFSLDEDLDPVTDEDYQKWKDLCLESVRPVHWQWIIRDLDHPREKVRAGALLLLYRHPSGELFLEKAREALRDPSEWVRLAAAGTLALRGDGSGAAQLAAGLLHPRWEVRWWSGAGLTMLGPGRSLPVRTLYALLIAARRPFEPDRWVKHTFDYMVQRLVEPRESEQRTLDLLAEVLETVLDLPFLGD